MARTVSLCLEEGQAVWFHSQARYVDSGYALVVEIHRCTALLDNGFSANRHTGVCTAKGWPSNNPPGFVYASREDWEQERALYRTWAALRKDIASLNDLPEGMTRRKLLQVRRLLQMED